MLQPIGAAVTAQNTGSRVRESCEQFEALLISKLLESAWPDARGQDALLGHAREVIAGSLAKSGGLGVAEVLARSLSPQTQTPDTPAMAPSEGTR